MWSCAVPAWWYHAALQGHKPEDPALLHQAAQDLRLKPVLEKKWRSRASFWMYCHLRKLKRVTVLWDPQVGVLKNADLAGKRGTMEVSPCRNEVRRSKGAGNRPLCVLLPYASCPALPESRSWAPDPQ